MRVYQAGPINDIDAEDARQWRENIRKLYPNIDWVNPFDHIDVADTQEIVNGDGPDPTDVVNTDLSLIDSCDAMFVNWCSDCQTVGTPMEMFYAKRMKQIPVVVWADGDCPSPWLVEHADEMKHGLDMSVRAIKRLVE